VSQTPLLKATVTQNLHHDVLASFHSPALVCSMKLLLKIAAQSLLLLLLLQYMEWC
jgi:hypothetical protein